ncbi:MAG: rRNA maturation RNase YbeY [Dongiaceae bacterium]
MVAEVEIAVRILEPRWKLDVPAAVATARRAASAALAASMPAKLRQAARRRTIELNLVLADDRTVRRLNREFRNVDKPTNVLSFGDPAQWRVRGPATPIVLGDVILARETVTAEAVAQGKPMKDHARHLIVHGVLHLLGHDHLRRSAARKMEAIEIGVLAQLGVANPYWIAGGKALPGRAGHHRT